MPRPVIRESEFPFKDTALDQEQEDLKAYPCVECGVSLAWANINYDRYEPHPVDGSKYCFSCAWLEGFLNEEGQVDGHFYSEHGEQARLERGRK